MYRKPTHTGKYLDFQSNHPVAHKRAVVSSLLTRAKRICKDGNNLEAELKIVRRELSGNGYPQHFVERIEKQILQPKAANRKVFTTTAGIPYVRGISEALARIFADYDLRIGHVPASKLRNELVKKSRTRCPIIVSPVLSIVSPAPIATMFTSVKQENSPEG